MNRCMEEERKRRSGLRLGLGLGAKGWIVGVMIGVATARAQALHDYSVARARFQRAAGDDMEIVRK